MLKFSSVLKDLVLGVWTVPQQVMNACKLWLLEQQPWIICHVWFETTLLPLSHSGFPVRFNSVTASSVNNITPKLEQLNIIQPSLTVCVGFLGLFFSTRIFPFVSHYKNNTDILARLFSTRTKGSYLLCISVLIIQFLFFF